jgi:hypothetical protein
MEQQQQPQPPGLPPRLDYQQPAAPKGRFGPRGMYVLGLMAGLGFSVIYYVLLGLDVTGHTPAGPLGAVVLKLGIGIGLLFVRGWKAFGVGLITSVPIAVLIFVGLCFGILAWEL